MKKYVFTAGMMVALASLNACKGGEAADDVTKFKSGCMPTEIKVVDDYQGLKDLHYVEIDDYCFDSVVVDVDRASKAAEAAACSEVRKGDFVARNLDWYQHPIPTYVMKVAHSDAHYASLSVCGNNYEMKRDTTWQGISQLQANKLMRYTQDGVNEHGLYVGVNVVPFGQMSVDASKVSGLVDYDAPEDGVNAKKPKIKTSLLTRLLLDSAKDLKEAKEIIQGTNWADLSTMPKSGFQLHWLVADATGSFVCEFVDGKPVFVDAASTTTPDYGNIMTNFSNYLMSEKGMMQSRGSGYERWNMLKSMYDSAEGLEGAKNCAKAVFYSKMYSEEYDKVPNFFFTEYYADDKPSGVLLKFKDPAERSANKAVWDKFLEAYAPYHTADSIWNWRKHGLGFDRKYWFTTHSSIWNLKEKSLVLDLEEQGEFKVKFEL